MCLGGGVLMWFLFMGIQTPMKVHMDGNRVGTNIQLKKVNFPIVIILRVDTKNGKAQKST